MGAQWPVLGAVLLTVLVSAVLAAALAVFAWQVVPQAVHHELATSGTSILVSGPVTGGELTQDTAAVRSDMRSAFGDVPFAFYAATWSERLTLPAAQQTPTARTARTALTQAVSADALMASSVLTSGHWPAPPRPGGPVPAALPVAAAALLHVAVGDVLMLGRTGSAAPVPVVVTGEFRPRDPASPYWRLDLIGPAEGPGGPAGPAEAPAEGPAGPGAQPGGQTATYGPLVVNPAAFQARLAVASASWVAIPGIAGITDGDLGALSARISQEQQLMLDSATLGELTMTTSLPATLSGLASNVVVADSMLAIGGLLLLLLDATALTLASRLLASQRQVESAQVSARGGARWQLVRLNLPEAVAVAALAACGGVLAGGRLAGLLARTGPLRGAGLRASPFTFAALWAAVTVSVLCVLVLLGYALLDSSDAWIRRGRAAVISGLVRSGADAALVLLAAVAVWELRRYSAPSASGGLAVDPVLALAPALALAAGTILLLRLVPAVARGGDRLAARGRRLLAPLASWQISRRPDNQAGVALLVVLSVATGMLALSQHQSWVRSVRDQAAFTAGADARVDTPAPVSAAQAGAIATAPGVRDAMPVAQLGYGDTGQAIALDASKAASTALLRPDLSPEPAAALFARITPGGRPPGLLIPGRPARLEVSASLGPAGLPAPAKVTVSVQDADGNVYALPVGTLAADGRAHDLIAIVAPGRRAVYPLRLISVSLTYQLPAAASGHPAVLAIRAIAASAAASGPFETAFAAGTALGTWQPSVSSPALAALLQNPGSIAGPAMLPSTGSWRAAAAGAQALDFNPGFGQVAYQRGVVTGALALTAPMPAVRAIPGLASEAYLKAAGVDVGSTVRIQVDGAFVLVRIVAAVSAFPTITATGGVVIVDLAALQDALAFAQLPPAPVSEWWLRMATANPPPGLPAGSAVTLPGRLASGMLADPLSAAPQQALLALALAAAVLALAGFTVSIAANISQRRAQDALLSALGVSRSAQARQLCLEELMLSGPAAATGLVLGAVLGWLLVPAVTLTAGAVAPVPPALTEFAWSRAVPLAVVVAALPVAVAAVTVARRPDPAAVLRTTETT